MKKAVTALSIIRFSKKIVIFCISFVTIYTVIAIIYQVMTRDALSDVLTERIFSTMMGELCVTGLIKIAENVAEAFGKRVNEDGTIDEDTDFSNIKEEVINENELDSMMCGSSFNAVSYEPATQSETQD